MKALITNPANATAATTIVPAATSYSGATPGTYTLTGLVIGQAYSWIPGANDTSIVVNANVTLAKADLPTGGCFTATATTATMKGATSASITAIVSLTTLLYPGTFTPGLPSRQITVGQFPAANPNWIRQVQMSDEALFVKRGTVGVAISIADLVNLALSQETGLTWTPPIILTQPVSVACVGTAFATGTLTGSGSTNVTDGDTVTIGSTVYRFKTIMVAVNDIQIAGSGNSDTSLNNLIAAINGTGVAGTNWFLGTVASTQVTAAARVSHAFTVTAIIEGVAGNALASTETSSVLSFGAATLTGGTVSAKTFTVSPGSEYVLTYQWQYSTDSSTWNNATGTVNGTAYTNGTTAILTCTPATAGQTGTFYRCTVTDDAGAFGGTNGATNTNGAAVLTIP